jgi:hypothetical protein
MTRIVTYAHRYKRPPRKKAVALQVPAVVRRVKAGNDNRPDPEPALHPDDGKQPAIVTAKKPGRRQAAAWGDDDQSDPEMRAWLERAKWGHGPSR